MYGSKDWNNETILLENYIKTMSLPDLNMNNLDYVVLKSLMILNIYQMHVGHT